MVSLCIMIASKDQLGSGLHLLHAESITGCMCCIDPLRNLQQAVGGDWRVKELKCWWSA